MDKQEIFDFLKENLSLSIDAKHTGAYYESRAYVSLDATLVLKNPATGEAEMIGSSSTMIDLE